MRALRQEDCENYFPPHRNWSCGEFCACSATLRKGVGHAVKDDRGAEARIHFCRLTPALVSAALSTVLFKRHNPIPASSRCCNLEPSEFDCMLC